jgi:hypothetical protein
MWCRTPVNAVNGQEATARRPVIGMFSGRVLPVATATPSTPEVDGPKGRRKDEPQRATFRLRT